MTSELEDKKYTGIICTRCGHEEKLESEKVIHDRKHVRISSYLQFNMCGSFPNLLKIIMTQVTCTEYEYSYNCDSLTSLSLLCNKCVKGSHDCNQCIKYKKNVKDEINNELDKISTDGYFTFGNIKHIITEYSGL